MTGSDIDVRFENVEKRYNEVVAVRDLTLDIPRGTFFGLLGPSGCGKTTTLRMIAGFEQPTQGDVFIRGERVTGRAPYKRNFGMVFQNYALFPHMTVAENVAFGLKMRRIDRAERETRVREAIDTVKLSGFADRYPKQLSGGQQQRVALARAIVIRPAVLLLDEPLGALDKLLREEMQVELRDLQKSLGITTVFVTHDQEEALTMSDQVAVMRAGLIEQIGPPLEIYERPKTEFVAGFLGASNFLDGTVVGSEGNQAIVDIGGAAIPVRDNVISRGQRVRLAVRPEKVALTLDEKAGGIPATVREVIYRGSSTHIHLDRNGQGFLAFLQNDESRTWSPRPGMQVQCHWAPQSVVVLGAS
ncbi:ABC transporter ATP-binding protein [Microvirga massiliensis]|uniref:ABC transporter ATP-binding protein n=1 Tax=Microvirga massiliensis TaxID=1033741 RepID=UPI00062B3D2D|nr:ABC transporter ATP-binding protein [Microvirga massiliensis]